MLAMVMSAMVMLMACSTDARPAPVFRHSLERRAADVFEVDVFSRGEPPLESARGKSARCPGNASGWRRQFPEI